jgi:hypothetical protein
MISSKFLFIWTFYTRNYMYTIRSMVVFLIWHLQDFCVSDCIHVPDEQLETYLLINFRCCGLFCLSSFCVLWPMLPVFLDCPFVIALSVYVYFWSIFLLHMTGNEGVMYGVGETYYSKHVVSHSDVCRVNLVRYLVIPFLVAKCDVSLNLTVVYLMFA